jgi:uncharacterized protein YndB with AHSA1/START domain
VRIASAATVPDRLTWDTKEGRRHGVTDSSDPIADTKRELRKHPSGLKALRIRRRFAATPDQVWDAIADPEQLERWFLSVSGDLREGGRYRLEGTAVGEIVRCDKPREIAVTWEALGGTSEVRVRLIPEGNETVVELEQGPVPPDVIPNAAPETWGVGVAWEMGLTALGDYLGGRLPEGRAIDWIAKAPPEELEAGRELSAKISSVWTELIARDREHQHG